MPTTVEHRPPRWERRKESRPAELIAAALDLFVERGYASTRLDEVAGRAGVSKGTLYLYFESKEDLFKAVVRETIVPLIREHQRGIEQSELDSARLLERFFVQWWEHFGSTRLAGIAKLIMAEAGNFPEVARFFHDEVIAPNGAVLAAIVQRGVERGEFAAVDIEAATHLWMAPLVLKALWAHSFDAICPAGTMKRRTLAGVALVAIALLAGTAWIVRQRASAPRSAPSAGAPGADAAGSPTLEFAAADLMSLAPASIARTIPLTGSLRATNQTLVRAKVAGEIMELAVREGMEVKAGQLLARIDPIDFESRVREREAQARSAQAQVEQARRTLENNRQLLAKNFISQNAFDNAQSGYDVALANRDAALAQLTQARKALADTAVTAPMAGIVAERFAQVGEKVSPDNRIVSIVDLSRMEIEAPVPSSEIGSVRIGQEVVLRIEGIDLEQKGQIVRINPATSAGTRSVPVYIGLDNRDPRIRAGLFAQGTLEVGTHQNVLVIPTAALRESGGRSFVYVIDGDRLAERDVQTGMSDASGRAPNGSIGVVEITGGLKAGERIVAANLGALRPGSRVSVVKGSGTAAAAK